MATTTRRAERATPEYIAQFQRLTAEGWTLSNYGGGWRYFGRPIEDTRGPDGMRLHEVCRVHQSGKIVEAMEPQRIA